MQFLGNNDTSTLAGVVEDIDGEIRIYKARLRNAKTQRDKDTYTHIIGLLIALSNRYDAAAQNGPTPDLSKLRIVIPEESAKHLLGRD